MSICRRKAGGSDDWSVVDWGYERLRVAVERSGC